ncbi:hypothetical protein DT075_27120 [Bacillus licheniformis]|nr:hypothetical protein DT075_27120 [Bacillus licheniformis]
MVKSILIDAKVLSQEKSNVKRPLKEPLSVRNKDLHDSKGELSLRQPAVPIETFPKARCAGYEFDICKGRGGKLRSALCARLYKVER